MTSKTALIAAAVLAASATAALAHSNDTRRAEQARWIEAGRESGDITWREGLKLRRQQEEIRRTEMRMKADGRLSRWEKRRLHSLQDEAQNNIAQESSDRWRRIWWLPRVGR